MPQKRPQRGQPGCRPIDAMVDLGHPRVDGGDRGQIADAMAAGADLLDPDARQPEDDLGFRCAAQEAVGARIRRGRVAAHREAEGRGAKALALVWIEWRERHHQARWTKGPCAGSIKPTTAWSIDAAKLTLSTRSGELPSNPSTTGFPAPRRGRRRKTPRGSLHLCAPGSCAPGCGRG